MEMNRRGFLKLVGSALAAGALGSDSKAEAQPPVDRNLTHIYPSEEKLEEITGHMVRALQQMSKDEKYRGRGFDGIQCISSLSQGNDGIELLDGVYDRYKVDIFRNNGSLRVTVWAPDPSQDGMKQSFEQVMDTAERMLAGIEEKGRIVQAMEDEYDRAIKQKTNSAHANLWVTNDIQICTKLDGEQRCMQISDFDACDIDHKKTIEIVNWARRGE